jgi:hypothetical protein
MKEQFYGTDSASRSTPGLLPTGKLYEHGLREDRWMISLEATSALRRLLGVKQPSLGCSSIAFRVPRGRPDG